MKCSRQIKGFIAVLLITAMLCAGVAPPFVTARASALENEISVYVDGVKVQFDVPPLIINGRTMVPLRAIFEALGAEVEWSQEQMRALATNEDTTVCLHVGSLHPSVNNAVRSLEVPAVIVNNRTLAPLRFVGEAFGGTVTWNGATRTVNIYTDPARNQELPKTLLDFSISSSDLSLVEEASPSRTYVRPGVSLKMTIKILKDNPDVGGGGKVRVTFGDREIDVLPFYIDAGKDYVVFYKDYQIPLDFAPDMSGTTDTQVILKAEVVGDQLVQDSNPGNNTARTSVQVLGTERPVVEEPSDSRIVSIKARSDFGTGVAKAGSYLILSANITGTGKETIVGFYIDGSLIEEKAITQSKSGSPTQTSHTFHVPWENSGLIRYSVKLDNGDEAFIPVSIEPFEYGVVPDSITWQKKPATANYTPGETIALEAKITRDNRYSFNENFGALRAYFLINGQLSPGLKVEPPSGTAPYMGEVHYSYKVPAGQSTPLTVRVMTDPGDLLQEEREDNNSASVSIPQVIAGTAGNNLSIGTADIRHAPSHAIPGEKIELIATIRNNASTVPQSGVRILFRVNGEIINASDPARPSSYFNPGQTYTAYKVWEVPEDWTGAIDYSVEIDPDGVLTGDNATDNKASRTIPLAKAELAVEPNSLTGSPNLVSGGSGLLKARIYNAGPVNAEGVEVVFSINQSEVGRSVVDMPAYSTLELTSGFTAPVLPSAQSSSPLTGVSGYVPGKADIQGIQYAVRIDPLDTVEEGVETNNSAGPKELKVLVPGTRGTVFSRALDLQGNPVSGVAMRLMAGLTDAATVSAVSDAAGYCTFHGVPFGPVEVAGEKTGYLRGVTVDEQLYSGDHHGYVEVYLDDRSVVTGRVTSASGSPLDGAVLERQNPYDRSATSDSSGNFSLRLQAGSYSYKCIRRGYAPQSEDIMAGDASEITRNIVMVPTEKAWAYGKVYDINGAIVSNLTIQAVDASKRVLATATTDASGSYRIEIPLPQEEMWIGISATHAGVTRTSPGYVWRGLEYPHNVSFEVEPEPVSTQSGSECRVAPYVVCASVPGTFFTQDYEVEAIYGLFDLNLFATVENGYLTYLDVETNPQYWVSATVSGSWDPGELLGLDDIPGYDIISAILPLSIPLAVNMHSTNETMTWIKKISILSDEREIYAAYPDAVGDFAAAPNLKINWDTCRIKLYLKVDPDNGVSNPAAGYNLDRVLVVWNPKHKTFTKIGNYQVIGWDEAAGREIYMDEP